jgi:hypothetical protein
VKDREGWISRSAFLASLRAGELLSSIARACTQISADHNPPAQWYLDQLRMLDPAVFDTEQVVQALTVNGSISPALLVLIFEEIIQGDPDGNDH